MINIKEWGISARVIFTATVPVIIFSVFFGIYIIDVRNQDLLNEKNQRGELIAATLATAAEFAVATQDKKQIQLLVDSSLKQKDVIGVKVFNESSMLLYQSGHYGSKDKGKVSLYQSKIFSVINFDVSLNYTDVEPKDGEREKILIGMVDVYITNESYLKRQDNIIVNMTMLISIGIVVSVILAMLISNGLVRSIRDIVNGVKLLTNGDLSRRISVESGGDLGRLQSGINEMAETIEGSQVVLENRVKEAVHDREKTIGELKNKNVDLDKAIHEATLAKDAKSEFLANMSHEIRTPLNAIIGFSRQLARTELSENQVDFSNTINTAARQLLTVIDDILSFSKLESGDLQIKFNQFELRECLEDIISIFSQYANENYVELILLVDGDVPDTVIGDSDRLTQVLTNLINNAIKFTLHGSVVIHISVDDVADAIHVSVKDTGCGMSVEAQSQLFTPFYQENQKPTKRHSGTGLGLVISKRLITMMGGELAFSSDEGVGSDFYFSLPLEFIAHHDYYLVKNNTRVYLLDEHTYSRRAIRNNLLHLGVQVFAVSSKEKLIDSIISNETDKSADGDAIVMISLPFDCHPDQLIIDFYDDIRVHFKGLIILISSHEILYENDYKSLNIMVITKPVRMSALASFLSKEDNRRNSDEISILNDFSGYMILVAEDNEFNQKYINSLLHHFGFTVVCVSTGLAAVEACEKYKFDMVLMDLHMPDLGGVDAVKRIRASESDSSAVPIVAITADVFANDENKLLNSGFTDCVFKPIDEDKLTLMFYKYLNFNEDKIVNILSSEGADNQSSCNIENEDTLLSSSFLCIPIDMQKQLMNDLGYLYTELQSSFDRTDFNAAAEQVHSVLGLVLYFQVDKLVDLVKELKSSITKNDLKSAQTLLKRIIDGTHAIGAELN